MNFQEAEAYLYSLGNEVSAMKLGLENIRKLLSALGDPQKNYLKVQVAVRTAKVRSARFWIPSAGLPVSKLVFTLRRISFR